ncbi:FISUMP domain-containing protein [Fibrobacter sp. UWEL]|uniref:FISUMP domain-containing protein n=1 Tax=Fibrobacter sp. UWEL TaxID=1896209 RepID=UPI0009188E6A|nr:FISUMP domain-containing protein [Fibrobacter sp. UWEL]SHK45344.1 major paralogous domain-containing protein [Fibrobacter sp. UWEL]
MNVFKTLAVMAFVVGFVACGGDNGSNANNDDPSSSSVAQDDDSCSKNSSSSEEAKSSSSSEAKSSSSTEVSSSSVETKDKSSSSVKPTSSAEAKDPQAESSGDACIGIAEAQCLSSESKSSSSVASSSSVIVSSSSQYKPYNHSRVFYSDSIHSGAYKQFTDARNGRKYYYLTINGRNNLKKFVPITVMAENLNIGVDVPGVEDQKDDSIIERYCYDDDTTKCDRYGGLYQWAEMMQLPSRCNTESCAELIKENHQGICPDGWRLLTYDDYEIIVNAKGNDAGVKGTRSEGFGGLNYSGFSLVGAGYNLEEGFVDLNESTCWHYPVESSDDPSIRSMSGLQMTSNTYNSIYPVRKTNGLSVRCVMVETEE